MAQAHIIRRTEKTRRLKALLKEKRIVYVSSFFYSGKTLLLDQLADTITGDVVRYDAERDDWDIFARKVETASNCTLLIDSLHKLGNDGTAEKIASLLFGLSDDKCAVLAGRGQLPAYLHRLCASGIVTVVDKDFVMFSEDEIEQLYLDYGIAVTPPDIAHLKETYWGYAFALHIVAQKALQEPGRPLRSMKEEALREVRRILITDVVLTFPEQERILLYNLSPFDRFTEEMARMVTGRTDAPRIMREISQKSYLLSHDGAEHYYFVPFVQQALFSEMQNLYSLDYIHHQYERAALYYELQNHVPKAIDYYIQLNDTEKIRELLIRDTHNRPGNGDYVELKDAYAMLSDEVIMTSPELMKGMCMIEGLRGHAEESERWYQALKRFIDHTPTRDFSRRTAEEAVAYLDICLPQRGTKQTLNRLIASAKMQTLTQSKSWRGGFNVAGNSVSLMNGGLDFSRWVPHGWQLYRVLKTPIEAALGRSGSGMGDIAIGECELESNLSGNYGKALDMVCAGLARATGDLEMRCAAIGIQSRIITAQGNAHEAIDMIDNLIATLPPQAPVRLRQNLAVYRLTLQLMNGDTQEALSWLTTDAPDETVDFIILDRYRYLLKLRLYIITAQWKKTQLLAAQLRHYLESYDRPYMRVQLFLLQAMIDRRGGSENWRENISGALRLAQRFKLARVIADEGIGIVDMLNEMNLPDDPWERGVLQLTRAQAAHYPNYMKQIASKPVFTDREYQVYSLMIAGYKNAKIASILSITERTVKHYTRVCFQKHKSEREAKKYAIRL